MNLSKIANGMTISRLIALPLFLISIICFYANSSVQLLCHILFIYLISTDLVDGYLARKSGKKNYIGNFIDPLADKLFLGMGFIFMVAFWRKPPLWVMLIIAGRYAIIGFLWYAALAVSKEKFDRFLTMENVITTPNLLGKAATWSEVILFGMLIFQFPSIIISIFYILVPSISIATGINYLYLTLSTIKNYQSIARTPLEMESLKRMNDFLIKYKIFK
jgi:CDP-diacylglycerol--glycerol-3-phosphate 3-phosphatidyltransferase